MNYERHLVSVLNNSPIDNSIQIEVKFAKKEKQFRKHLLPVLHPIVNENRKKNDMKFFFIHSWRFFFFLWENKQIYEVRMK